MKKLNIFMVLLLTLSVFTACTDDKDSNPTYQEPKEFVLNTPAYASTIVDLKNSDKLTFSWSQPDYGYTAATSYTLQIGLSSEFKDETEDVAADYWTSPTIYPSAKVDLDAETLAKALLKLLDIKNEEDPKLAKTLPLYVRVKAEVKSNGMGSIISNVIELPKVQPYFASKTVELPQTMYICKYSNGWDWKKSVPMVLVNGNMGMLWSINYYAANTEMMLNSEQEDSEDKVQFTAGICPDASVALAGVEAGDNGGILIKNAGWYITVITSTLVEENGENKLSYQVEFRKPDIYLTGNPAGGWNVFEEANKFTVPTTLDGEFVSPVFLPTTEQDGDDPAMSLRICVLILDSPADNWWKSEFLLRDGVIEYRGNGGDQNPRVVVEAGKRAYLNFSTGTGHIE